MFPSLIRPGIIASADWGEVSYCGRSYCGGMERSLGREWVNYSMEWLNYIGQGSSRAGKRGLVTYLAFSR